MCEASVADLLVVVLEVVCVCVCVCVMVAMAWLIVLPVESCYIWRLVSWPVESSCIAC